MTALRRRAVIAAAFAAAALVACSPTEPRVLLGALRADLGRQYHACVPLGWNPVPVARTYYPGTSVVVHEEGVWLPVLWIASVDARLLKRHDVRVTFGVLNELVRAGMLTRQTRPHGYTYRLTPAALPYFFGNNAFGDNPDAIPYLCFSTIVPRRIVAVEPARDERRNGRAATVLRAAFAWEASPDAPWARTPFLRAHSVILGPAENPSSAELVRAGGDWYVSAVSRDRTPLPHVVDASVWPPAPAPLGEVSSRRPTHRGRLK